VIWSSVASRLSIEQVEVAQVDVEVGQDQLVLDELPDDPGHLVAVELDDRPLTLILFATAGSVPLELLRRSARSQALDVGLLRADRFRGLAQAGRSDSVSSVSTTRRTPAAPISASTPR
jgi:hypothetical protein